MPVLKEYRCAAHGPFEDFAPMCPYGCPDVFVKQEIRTAPAARRPGTMKFIDEQLKGIANDYGVTDLKTDPKANLSALDYQRRKTEHKAEWIPIAHAAPGFSRQPDAKVPQFKPESMGFSPVPEAAAMTAKLPKPKPNIVASYKG
jgi:hypothetical protein